MASNVSVSAVIPTRHRETALKRTLASMLDQYLLPAEIIVVDASSDDATKNAIEAFELQISGACQIRYLKAEIPGAASQRNQGVAVATQPTIWFLDDDILIEPDCVHRLWQALESNPKIGGVNAMITNQKYHPPGLLSRTMFTLMHGRKESSFAGRVIGPAVHLLPEDRDDLPEVVAVEWLNTTCTMYRRQALPDPVFDSNFTGYSMMEDLTLSLRVGRNWGLANVRTARIYHDSQAGDHKSSVSELARMHLANRHYVMTEILQRRDPLSYARLILWELFGLLTSATSWSGLKRAPYSLAGQWRGLCEIMKSRGHSL